MLDGLDAVNWSELSHAYGPADDVPATLRALARGGISAEEGASEFWGNIWHQGTVYEATGYTVPFLIELLQSAQLRDKQWMLMLLASIAAGASGRKAHREASRAAVGKGIPSYTMLLEAVQSDVRTTAAHTLAQFPERRGEIEPVLERALLVETNADAEASLLLSLEAAAAPTPILTERLTRRLSPEADPRTRLVASLILARSAGPDTPPPVVNTLRGSIIHAEDVSKAYVFSVWEKEPAAEACAALWGIGEATALPTLLGLLPQVGGALAAYSVVDILMEKAFLQKWGGEKTRLVELGPTQRRILRAFVDEPALWQGNVLRSLAWHYGLPDTRDALKSFLAGSEVT